MANCRDAAKLRSLSVSTMLDQTKSQPVDNYLDIIQKYG